MMATYNSTAFPPRKKVVTYGKAAKRKPSSGPFGLGQSGASTTESVSSQASSEPPSRPGSEPPARDANHTERSKQASRQYGRAKDTEPIRRPVARASEEPADRVEEAARAKKRKIAPTSAPKSSKTDAAYSTPDSSPYTFQSPKAAARPRSPKLASHATTPPSDSQRTPVRDLEMKDHVEESSSLFSPKTSKALGSLGIRSEVKKPASKPIPLRPSQQPAPPSRSVPRSVPSAPAAKTAEPTAKSATRPPAPKKKRARLIDALVAQMESSSEEEEEESPPMSPVLLGSQLDPDLRRTPPPVIVEQPKVRTVVRPVSSTKKTYSAQRTMLEEDPMEALGLGRGLGDIDEDPAETPLRRFAAFGAPAKPPALDAFDFADEDDETANTGQVRSLYELRKAGADSRFADGIDDMLDRIGSPNGKPSPLRRGALLELAHKMREKSFRRQLRDHSGDHKVFNNVGEETDVVAGFAILSILVTLLSASASSYLVPQLRAQGAARLFGRLLELDTDIVVISKDRKNNVSRNGQTTVAAIKADILKLDIWGSSSAPSSLSPRTMVLKSLDQAMQKATNLTVVDDIFPANVTAQLFSILSEVKTPDSWPSPESSESTDVREALALLETRSVSEMQSPMRSTWVRQFVPIVADLLQTTLKRPAGQYGDMENLVLRLTLNVTNNNEEAPALLVRRGLLRDLAEAAYSTFDIILTSIRDNVFMEKVLESLIIMLGDMINFCEHYHPAAAHLFEQCELDDKSTLDRLIRVFLTYHSTTSEADSFEKTQLNVAFGYLSIVLGYLCLHGPIRARFESIHTKHSLEPLLNSMKEFIAFHQMAAKAIDDERADSGATQRLQRLVDQLERGY